MSTRVYLRPPWPARVIGNRMAALFRSSVVWKLSVRGRRTGAWRTVPVAVLDYEGGRYLMAPRGETDWVLNLRAAGSARLTRKGRTEEIAATEVPPTARPALIDAYLAAYGSFPTVTQTFRALPDPADHPTFRITPPASASARESTPGLSVQGADGDG